MTAPVRDPQTTYLYCESCSYTFTEYEIGYDNNDGEPFKVCPRCSSDRYHLAEEAPQPWPAHLTSEQRGDLRRACCEIRRLCDAVDSEDIVNLWRAATETLKELTAYVESQT